MNSEQLKTILWLRWRLMCNQWKHTRGLGAIFAVLIGIAAFSLAVLCFAGGFFGAFYGLGDALPVTVMFIWLGITIVFIVLWAIGLLTELQRSETIDLQKLMHLPVALGQMFVITLGPGNVDLSLPANIGLASAVAMKTMGGVDSMVVVGLLAALGCGLGVGIVNYLLIWALRIPPIIATLSASFVIQSIDISYGRGLQIKPPPGFAEAFQNAGGLARPGWAG